MSTDPPTPPPPHTVSFLLDGLWFWNSKTLHGLIFLLLGLVLLRLVLVLAVRVDEHSAVERVTVPPRTLAGPRDAVHWGEETQRGFKMWPPCGVLLDNIFCDTKTEQQKHGVCKEGAKRGYHTASERHNETERGREWRQRTCKKRRAVAG